MNLYAGFPSLILWITSLTATFICEQVTAHESDPFQGDDSHGSSLSTSVTVGLVLSIVVLITLGVVLWNCMDCYNSEVSSECHPATQKKKWGGASGYDGGDGYFVGEEINMADHGPAMAYALVPTGVPEQQGFAGYRAGGATQGMTGYAAAEAQPSQGASRHYNPAEDQGPPPSYSDYAANNR